MNLSELNVLVLHAHTALCHPFLHVKATGKSALKRYPRAHKEKTNEISKFNYSVRTNWTFKCDFLQTPPKNSNSAKKKTAKHQDSPKQYVVQARPYQLKEDSRTCLTTLLNMHLNYFLAV